MTTRATGAPSDASPEPREDAIAVAFAHAYQYAAYRHATIGAFEGRLRELGFAVTPLNAERTAHPVAASAALREALWEELRFVKGATDEVINRVADRLAAASPRATEPAEAGLRELVEFIADWAHDCSPSNAATPWDRKHGDEIDPRSYGFDDIEERCRVALRASR